MSRENVHRVSPLLNAVFCQADCYQTLNQHAYAIEALEEALCIVGNPTDRGLIRTKAHLLACWADNAISLGEYPTAQRQLDASATFLDQLEPSEEFDRATWLQLVGKYAFATGDLSVHRRTSTSRYVAYSLILYAQRLLQEGKKGVLLTSPVSHFSRNGYAPTSEVHYNLR